MKIHEMTVNEIRCLLKEPGSPLPEEIIAAMSRDTRSGVRKLYRQFCRQQVLADRERLRLEELQLYENEARAKGYSVIAGVDEAGRGPLAGPVMAAAVVFPDNVRISGIDDSKKISPVKREQLYHEIKEHALCWSVGISTVEEIDSLNILQASLLAMQRAVMNLDRAPEYILVDAVRIPGLHVPQLPIVKGDGKSASIAAASIVAKVTRDKMMAEYDREFPAYGFIRHKGYGTADHVEAIRKYGQCPLHRRTFTRNFIEEAVDVSK